MKLSSPCLWMAMATTMLMNANAQSISFTAVPMTIVIGADPEATPSQVDWTDGVCYQPITSGVHPGDKLLFEYAAHNVYRMASKEHFLNCNFTDATLLSQVGQSPFPYEISPEDEGEILYFACQVGDHCGSGTQKVQVSVSSFVGNDGANRPEVLSKYALGQSAEACNELQETQGAISESAAMEASLLRSSCSDPEPVEGEPNTFYRSCLSGPATLTPGGVINRLFVMEYPYPKDHRVAYGQRTFEFVYDSLDGEGVVPAPVNQLYVHHLSGGVIFGQGTEGVRREAPDAPFHDPYRRFAGDDGNTMIFHIIDLREVDDWLDCIECRCHQASQNTYFDALTQTGNLTGGVNCCTNCTSLAGPTLDYRMRYNVTYRELTPDDPPFTDVKQLTADISTVVGKFLEHDVPSAAFLPKEQQAPDNPAIQHLVKEAPFNEIFQEGFFQQPYSGPYEVKLLRCVAHLHVAAIEQYVEDTVTGERICQGSTVYGKDPETDQGFLTAVSVDDYDPPKVFPADRIMRFVTDYNATQVHTGVMGYWFVFTAGDYQVTAADTNMTVNLCMERTCDASMLPQIDLSPFQPPGPPGIEPPSDATNTTKQAGNPTDNSNKTADCVDTIATGPMCEFGGICDCETFVNAPESSGCNGFYVSPMGDINVRSVCANYCGCEVSVAVEEAVVGENMAGPPPAPPAAPAAPAAPTGCVDALTESPICRFGQLCECSVFVAEPESEGCGGMYKSEMGDTVVNDVCAKYCNACVEKSMDELFQETYMEVMTQEMRAACKYATEDCRALLNNLYSCAEGMPGIEAADPMIRTAVEAMGHQVALDSAKVGHPSTYGPEEQVVEMCSTDDMVASEEDEGEGQQDESGATTNMRGMLAALVGSVCLLLIR